MSQQSSQPEKNAASGGLAGASNQTGARSADPCGLKSRPWHLAVAGALAATLLWFFVLPRYPFVVYLHQGSFGPDPGEAEAAVRHQYINPSLLFASFACVISVAFAIAEGLARRSVKFALLGSGSGALVSSGFGALGGLLGQWVFDLPLYELIDLARSIVVQATCWCLVGFGAGLGFSLPTRRWRAIFLAATGAVAGALLAALIFGPASALVVQLANTETLVPLKSTQQLMWLGTAAVFMGCVAGGLARPRKAKAPSPRVVSSPAP